MKRRGLVVEEVSDEQKNERKAVSRARSRRGDRDEKTPCEQPRPRLGVLSGDDPTLAECFEEELYDINPEVEEDAEAHFEEMLENDPELRRVYEENRPRRELGRRVLGRRLDLGLSQKALAEKVGTSQNRVYLIEAGEANPTLDTLERLASALGTTFEIHPSEPVAG